MATAAETQSIIQLVVGMVNAAPGADILAELEAMVDGGMTIEEMAIAITANPAWSGDTGLFPDYLPNAVFAENFLTQLIGSEVTEDYLEEAVAEMTASLNAGDSRGAAINDAIDALAATDSADDDLGDAATALANKTEVATYYSVELATSSDDLDDLIAVVSGVDSDVDAVADGEKAVDDAIAGEQPLVTLIGDLDDANDAVAAYLKAVDLDSNPATATTESAITTAGGNVEGLIDITTYSQGAFIGGNLIAGGALTGASDALIAALISDQELILNNQVADAVTGAGTAKNLTTAMSKTTGTGSITGLDTALASNATAILNLAAANAAETVGDADLAAAIVAYNVIGTNDDVVTGIVAGTVLAAVTDGAPLIETSVTTKALVLSTGVTETTNPGITVLMAAMNTRNALTKAQDIARQAQEDSQNLVENLNPTTGANEHADLSDIVELLFSVSTATAAPTLLQMDVENNALAAIVTAGNAAALSNVDGATTHAAAIAQLDADIIALADGNAAAIAVLTDTAVTAGYITAADKALIDVGAAVSATAQTALNANNPVQRADDFDTALTAYLDFGYAGTATAFDPGNAGTITDTYVAAVAANDDALDSIEELADSVALLDLVNGLADSLEVLTDARDDAEDAFGAAGFGIPVTLSTAVVVATSNDDVYLTDDSSAQIINFGVETTTDGVDQLFIGSDLTLNTDTTAGDNGDNSVLEVWITADLAGDAVITIETSEFGSEAAEVETFAITLTGVAVADVNLDGGIITV